MLTRAENILRDPEILDTVDEEVDPQFPRSLNQRDGTKISQGVVVRLFGNWNQPPPFPKGGSGFMGPYRT
jgi:hypothetical protein